jgi:hypothetical protein
MDDYWNRLVTNLIGRLTGPLTLRLFLQPAVATFLGIRDGLMDARTGRPLHFWRMVMGPPEARKRRTKETWAAIFKVFTLAVVFDLVYQVMVFRWIYPVEAMITAVILAILPYMILRGVANRIARTWIGPERDREPLT